ncbi:peroxidase-related enzyme [Sphingorhabdus sp. Alg239-R122]|uniref:carboxymuconolactone decarboxylase family protein n=1 Tax=Sphingorhabdus sp. Alg239-R122 TaxID=2305989 RepID=UPI0013DAAFAD|nr:peroxidase-related enzyme [Sphingorhabdus sp. Alg239-R122]
MAYIKTIDREAAQGDLDALYAKIAGPDGRVDNILMAHSLRPHTLEGHMALYKVVLHHRGNALPKWMLESIGVLVSAINNCQYCVDHHLAGLKRLVRDEERYTKLEAALLAVADDPQKLTDAFTQKEHAALSYAAKLTGAPAAITENDIAILRAHGLEDGEILEVNQVAAYFAYANRTVLGLGCSTQGEELGLSPGDNEDPDNWSHG